MSASHTPFALLNAGPNRAVGFLLRSRLHPLLSGRLALITVTGRRSGQAHTLPVFYAQRGDVITIGVAAPERKRWWRNLVDGAPVKLWLRGDERTGRAVAHGDEASGVTVEVRLD